VSGRRAKRWLPPNEPAGSRFSRSPTASWPPCRAGVQRDENASSRTPAENTGGHLLCAIRRASNRGPIFGRCRLRVPSGAGIHRAKNPGNSLKVQDAAIGRTGYGVTRYSPVGGAAQRPGGIGIGRGVNGLSTLNQRGQHVAIRGRGDRHPILNWRGRWRPTPGGGEIQSDEKRDQDRQCREDEFDVFSGASSRDGRDFEVTRFIRMGTGK
jgi:hypothetical protein